MRISSPALGRLALLTIILTALGLRLCHLDSQSLWRDEVDTLRFATRPLPELIRKLIEPGENGPLYFLTLRPWLAAAGPSEMALRLPSAFAGTLAIPAIYILTRRLAGARPALIAALLAATAPFLIWYGQEAKMYASLTALIPLSLWWTTETVRRGGMWRWAALYALTSLSLYTHILAALIVPVQAFWLLLWPAGSSAGRPATPRWGAVGLYLMALILPYLPLARWQVPYWAGAAASQRPLASSAALLQALGVSFGHGVLSVRSPWQLLPSFVALLSGLLWWTTPGPTNPSQPPAGWRVLLLLLFWFLTPVLLILLISPGLPVLAERYLIWIIPALLILSALGVVSLTRMSRPLGATLLAIIVALNLAAVLAQSATMIRSDFRSAARFVAAHRLAGDLLLFQIPYARYAFTYYDARQSDAATAACLPDAELWFRSECGHGALESLPYLDGPYSNDDVAESVVFSDLQQALSAVDAVWLVSSEEELWDTRGLARRWLETQGQRTDHADFTRVSVTRYKLAP